MWGTFGILWSKCCLRFYGEIGELRKDLLQLEEAVCNEAMSALRLCALSMLSGPGSAPRKQRAGIFLGGGAVRLAIQRGPNPPEWKEVSAQQQVLDGGLRRAFEAWNEIGFSRGFSRLGRSRKTFCIAGIVGVRRQIGSGLALALPFR